MNNYSDKELGELIEKGAEHLTNFYGSSTDFPYGAPRFVMGTVGGAAIAGKLGGAEEGHRAVVAAINAMDEANHEWDYATIVAFILGVPNTIGTRLTCGSGWRIKTILSAARKIKAGQWKLQRLCECGTKLPMPT